MNVIAMDNKHLDSENGYATASQKNHMERLQGNCALNKGDNSNLQEAIRPSTTVTLPSADNPQKYKKIKVRKSLRTTASMNACNNKDIKQTSTNTLDNAHIEGSLGQRLRKCQLESITIEPRSNSKIFSIKHDECLSAKQKLKRDQSNKISSETNSQEMQKILQSDQRLSQEQMEHLLSLQLSPTPHEDLLSRTIESSTQTSKTLIPMHTAAVLATNVANNQPKSDPNCSTAEYLPRTPTSPRDHIDLHAFPLFLHYPCENFNNEGVNIQEDFCTIYSQSGEKFEMKKTTPRLKLPPISPKRSNKYTTASPRIRRMSWSQPMITGPVDDSNDAAYINLPLTDHTYPNNSHILPGLNNNITQQPRNNQLNVKGDSGLVKSPVNMKDRSSYEQCEIPNSYNATTTDGASEPRSRSEPFILPALNNQNRPELQILQRLLPPNISAGSDFFDATEGADETSQFTKLLPEPKHVQEKIWRSAPPTNRSDTNNDFFEIKRVNDLPLNMFSQRCNLQQSNLLVARSKLFRTNQKFNQVASSPKNDSFSILSRRTGMSLSYRGVNSRPTSGSVSKKRPCKYNVVVTPRNPQRRQTQKNPPDRKLIQPNCDYTYSHIEEQNLASETESSGTTNITPTRETVSLPKALAHVNSSDWEVSMKGLTEIVELSRHLEFESLEPEMSAINRRIIQILRSPRSHACRLACEVSGELFITMKLTKRPEFDEIVDLLLCKTADTNRFIRKDANIALDRMVTYIPPFHAVRALCSKGPSHKNHLVRCATVRLLVCIAVLAGTDNILSSNEYTRKRIFLNMAKFLMDKHLETRKYAERLFKMFKRNKYFEELFYRDVDMDIVEKLGKSLQRLCRK